MRFSEIIPLHEAKIVEAIDPAEGPSVYWFVLAKNGLARCVNENDSDYFDLLDQGWDLIWDSAKSNEKGLEFAYERHGYLPWDRMEPIPLNAPKVMYRSVSLPELKDILKTGAVTGKGSTFNETETRRWVFFGDQISKNLIWQGEDHQRYAQMSMDGHAIHAKHAEVAKQLKEIRQSFVEHCKRFVAQWNKRYAASGRPMTISDEDYQGALWGRHSSVVKLMDICRYDPNVRDARETMRDLEDAERDLNRKYRDLIGKKYQSIKPKIDAQMYSSAIIETKPLTGGLHYSDDHGESYFGSDEDGKLDEFTFPPGKVTVADIVRIHWVKDRQIIATSTVKAAPGILRKMSAKPAAPVAA
jgi:hypothetical protein